MKGCHTISFYFNTLICCASPKPSSMPSKINSLLALTQPFLPPKGLQYTDFSFALTLFVQIILYSEFYSISTFCHHKVCPTTSYLHLLFVFVFSLFIQLTCQENMHILAGKSLIFINCIHILAISKIFHILQRIPLVLLYSTKLFSALRKS